MNSKLIKNIEYIDGNKTILLCLPYAGGGAAAYNGWIKKIQDIISVCPVQLPGREERIMEKPYDNMMDLLDDLESAVERIEDNTYCLWGHSMGAKIAYELERRLEEKGCIAQYLFVSGSRVPHVPEPNPIYHLSDTEFKENIGRFEGTPKEILENQELLDFFLPMLRADFTMDEIYYTKEIQKIKCPIIAFGGIEDREADEAAIKEWKEYTCTGFIYKMFSGSHFFVREHEDEILKMIKENLEGYCHER